MDWKRLNPRVIQEFRANAGTVSGFENLPLLILQTLGARSGRRFDVPLIPVIEGDGMYLFGTNAGSTKTPAWVFNVRAHPEIVVEGENGHFKAVIQELPPGEAKNPSRKQGGRERPAQSLSLRCPPENSARV